MRSKRRRVSASNLLDCPQSLDANESSDVQLMLARFLSCIYQSEDYRIPSKENGSPSDFARALNFRVVNLERILIACGLVRRIKNHKLEVSRGQMDNFPTLYDHLGKQRLNFTDRPRYSLEFRYNELVPPLCRTQDDEKDKLIKLKKSTSRSSMNVSRNMETSRASAFHEREVSVNDSRWQRRHD